MTAKVTSIYDIARLTGVSYATVSRVINGTGRTSPRTKKAVLEAMAAHNFVPKLRARKPTVAIMLDLDQTRMEYYLPCVLAAVLERLSHHEISTEIFTRANIALFRRCFADAVIAMPWDDGIRDLLATTSDHIPRVCINTAPVPGCSTVASDHRESGRMAAAHLLARGHRRAGIVVNSLDWGNAQRVAGFRAGFAEHGVPPGEIVCGCLAHNTHFAVARQVLAAAPTALFIGVESPLPTLGALHALGVRIPDALSVIAMEQENTMHYLPPLTGIDQSLRAVAARAADLILRQMAEEDCSAQEILTANTLIERQSVLARQPCEEGSPR